MLNSKTYLAYKVGFDRGYDESTSTGQFEECPYPEDSDEAVFYYRGYQSGAATYYGEQDDLAGASNEELDYFCVDSCEEDIF